MLKDQLLLDILKEGTTPISNILLTNYKKIGLAEQEMMLLIHLLHFQGKGIYFPSIHELEKIMSIDTSEIMKLLQGLVKRGYIYIEENREKDTGIFFEAYNLTPLYLKVIKELELNYEKSELENEKEETVKKTKNLFEIFEQEFGRALSPIEIDLINTWMDSDKYADQVIILALKEAVYADKLYFRYIDRILLDWQKRNLKTEKQIKDYLRKYRTAKYDSKEEEQKKQNKEFEFYNWLENDE